jgi:hypothetical protein
MNIGDKVVMGLPRNFGWGLYEMIVEFLGTRPIFNPPHMWDIMDDANCIYTEQSNLTPIDAINLNNDSKDTTK